MLSLAALFCVIVQSYYSVQYSNTPWSMHSSEKAAIAFHKTRHNSRTKHYFANPRIKIQENMTI